MNDTKKSYKNVGEKLFVPEHFEFSNQQEILDYIGSNPLANCITQNNGEINSSCLPLFLDDSLGSDVGFIGHLARRNVQAKSLSDGQDILALFTSPSAYIPSRWYQDIRTAPTWSYVSVQLRGTLEIVSEVDKMMDIIQRCVNTLEVDTQPPWTPADIPADRLERLQEGIIAFKITNVVLEGICRLNQDQTENDKGNIISELSNRKDAGSDYIRNEMMNRVGHS